MHGELTTFSFGFEGGIREFLIIAFLFTFKVSNTENANPRPYNTQEDRSPELRLTMKVMASVE